MSTYARFHRLRVAAIERLTPDAVAITFEVPAELAQAYRYAAGQHVALRAPIAGDDVRRNYSICAPATSGVLRVGVKRLPGGVFSGYASERLRPGDELDVFTPSGRFGATFDPARARHYAAIAGGSGITPIFSILATALEVEPASRATLIYANRTARDVMFADELADLRDRYLTRLDLLHVLDGEQLDTELLCGTLDGERLGRILDLLLPVESVDEWFLCGPEGLTAAAKDTLLARGVDDDQVHRELFLASSAPDLRSNAPPAHTPTVSGARVSATLDGRSTTVQVSGQATVLDAVLEVRPDAPFACKSGVCGTCRARLLEGTVDLASNYALDRRDLAAGYVLTCQARPTSESVVLDFDA